MRPSVVVAAIVLTCAGAGGAEGVDDGARLGVSVTAGGGASFQAWHFDLGIPAEDLGPALYLAGGLSYGPMGCASQTAVSFTGEWSYLEVGTTGSQPSLSRSAELRVSVMPALLYMELHTSSSFGPFVRLGAGAARVNWAETYEPHESNNVEFDYWSFCFGGGGGIRYSPSARVDLMITSDWILVPGEHVEARPYTGSETGIMSNIGFGSGAVRVVMRM